MEISVCVCTGGRALRLFESVGPWFGCRLLPNLTDDDMDTKPGVLTLGNWTLYPRFNTLNRRSVNLLPINFPGQFRDIYLTVCLGSAHTHSRHMLATAGELPELATVSAASRKSLRTKTHAEMYLSVTSVGVSLRLCLHFGDLEIGRANPKRIQGKYLACARRISASRQAFSLQ